MLNSDPGFDPEEFAVRAKAMLAKILDKSDHYNRLEDDRQPPAESSLQQQVCICLFSLSFGLVYL